MWAPLWGFMYGPRLLICARACNRTSGERRDSGAAYPVLLIPSSQSRGGGGRGARGLGYYREFSN